MRWHRIDYCFFSIYLSIFKLYICVFVLKRFAGALHRAVRVLEHSELLDGVVLPLNDLVCFSFLKKLFFVYFTLVFHFFFSNRLKCVLD